MQYYHVRCKYCSTVLQTDIAFFGEAEELERHVKAVKVTCSNCHASDTYDSTKLFLLRNSRPSI